MPCSSRLGHPVMAEAVPGVAADRVGDPLAAAVDGLEETKLKTRPKCLGHYVGWLRGRCRCVGEVELATDARQRTQHLPINACAAGRGSWPRNSAAVAVISIDVRTRRSQLGWPPAPTGIERAFPLRAVQQLTDLQRIALGSVVEFGGHIA